MLSVEWMTAAGWGAAMIDTVLDADRRLARGEDNPSLAYWLRDVWQVAWEQEQCKGGPWTTAAHLYASIGGGAVPIDPIWDKKALDLLTAQINEHPSTPDQLFVPATPACGRAGRSPRSSTGSAGSAPAWLPALVPPPARIPVPFSTQAHAAALVQHTPIVVAAISAMDRRNARIAEIDARCSRPMPALPP